MLFLEGGSDVFLPFRAASYCSDDCCPTLVSWRLPHPASLARLRQNRA